MEYKHRDINRISVPIFINVTFCGLALYISRLFVNPYKINENKGIIIFLMIFIIINFICVIQCIHLLISNSGFFKDWIAAMVHNNTVIAVFIVVVGLAFFTIGEFFAFKDIYTHIVVYYYFGKFVNLKAIVKPLACLEIILMILVQGFFVIRLIFIDKTKKQSGD